MFKGILILILFPFIFNYVQGQDTPKKTSTFHQSNFSYLTPGVTSSSNVNKQRLWLIIGTNAALWTSSFIALNQAWYADFPRSSFHFFNDNKEWDQMDKAGHIWSTFLVSRVSTEMWNWTGLAKKKSVILGGISGMAYQAIIEIQDGFSSEWGFSWGDMTANLIGASTFVIQELSWNEQRFLVKMSYLPYHYSGDLIDRRNHLFGVSTIERLLKDYNSQTYWISANLKSFIPNDHFPGWLNISLGYSADGMLGARANQWTDKQGVWFDRTDIPRTRRFFISPDIDFMRIKTKNKFVRSLFFVLNMIKIPSPALELNSKGNFRAHLLYY